MATNFIGNLNLAALDPVRLQIINSLIASSSAVAPAVRATPTPIPHVQPGDLITSDLINKLIDQIQALQATAIGTSLQLGPLGDDTHTVVALGSGFETTGGIWVDGVPQLIGAPGRGINLVILNAQLQPKFRGTYDTFATAAAVELLTSDITTQTVAGDVVIGVTHDAYIANLVANTDAGIFARRALAAIGAASLGVGNPQTRRTRDNAAFIGITPNSKAGVSYDYLVSVMPADSSNDPRLAALPFAWGLYSIPLQRFLVGGSSAAAPYVSVPTPG